MSPVPFVKVEFRRMDYDRKLKLGFNNIRQHPQWELREAFFSSIGVKCSSNLSCPACGGEGVHPACEYCNDGYQTCGECEGEATTDCDHCDGTGELESNCDECGSSGHIECSNDKCDKGVITCESCEDGQEECPTCEGDGKDADEECSKCDGVGTTDCKECDGEVQYNCDTCGGESQEDCEWCEAIGVITESCDECGGGGELTCGYCDDGYNECEDCGGDADESECDDCEGQGNFVREHEKAGDYYLNPIRVNRKKRVEMFDTSMKDLWPQIVEDGYKVDFIPIRKIHNNYFKQKIFDKVTLLFVPCGDWTYIFIINHLKPNIENHNEMGIYYQVTLETLTGGWKYHLPYGAKTPFQHHTHQAILNAPLYNEAMIITTNIKIWEPFTINYLSEPTQKT